jgi:hypothetical protein
MNRGWRLDEILGVGGVRVAVGEGLWAGLGSYLDSNATINPSSG